MGKLFKFKCDLFFSMIGFLFYFYTGVLAGASSVWFLLERTRSLAGMWEGG